MGQKVAIFGQTLKISNENQMAVQMSNREDYGYLRLQFGQ